MASPTRPAAAPIGPARIALGLALILVVLGPQATSARLAAAFDQTAHAFRGQNVGAVGPILPIVAPDGTVYVWTTAPGAGGTIVALDPAGKTRPGWPVAVGGASPQVLTPDGTLMTMACADLGPCRLGALRPDGRAREGWPVTLGGTRRCDTPLPGPRQDLYVVCDRSSSSRRVFRLAETGQMQRGFPVSIAGTTHAQHLTGDVLYLLQAYSTGMRVIAIGPESTIRRSPLVASIGDAIGNAAGSRGFALAPDGTAFAWGYHTRGPMAFGPSALVSSELTAFDLNGTLSGWPYRTPLPISAPAFGAGGLTYVTEGTATSNGRVVALARSRRSAPGWPARLPVPAVTGHEGAGNIPYRDVPSPIVGPDGTVFVASVAGGGTTVMALTQAGRMRAGWPIHSSRTLASECAPRLDTGCGDPRQQVLPTAGGTLFVPLAATPHDGGQIAAVALDGHSRTGWPFTAASSASVITSMTAGIDGRLYVAEYSGSHGTSASLTALDRVGRVVYTTTLIGSLITGGTVTLADDGRTVTLHVGDRFLLNLGFGFDWIVSTGNPNVLARVLNIVVIAGAQGVYEATAAGRTTLSATGDPPCRKAIPPCAAPSRLFAIEVVVQ